MESQKHRAGTGKENWSNQPGKKKVGEKIGGIAGENDKGGA